MKKVEVEITGLPPGLLMHRFPLEGEDPGLKNEPREKQADLAAYRVPKTGELYIPGMNLKQALVAAAAYSKGKGKATLAKVTAAALFISPEYIGLGTKDFEVFSTSVVIRATKGRVIRHRPHLPEWKAKFSVEYDGVYFKVEQVKKILEDAGALVGVLDFRPACKGPYGRFMVTKFEPIAE